MKALAIARTNLVRTMRLRANIFFVFVFPMLLIFVLGAAFGGSGDQRIGLVAPSSGPLARELVTALQAAKGIEVRSVSAESDLMGAVERGELEAGLVIPSGYDQTLRSGQTATLRFVARSGPRGPQIASIVMGVVDQQAGRIRAARFAGQERGVALDQSLRDVDAVAGQIAAVRVDVQVPGAKTTQAEGRFDTGASTQLLLFLFVTSLMNSVALIETRRLGISRRMLATPTTSATIVAGEGVGRFAVSAVQGVFVMIASALIFGVSWGDPVAAGLLMVSFALVASGAGMLMGALARSPQQATAVAILLGLGLGALGGTMMPLEFFSPAMRTAAHVLTPHAWAVDGYNVLVREGGGVVDILAQLGVLLGAAAVLISLASWRLRRSVLT